MSQFDIRAFGAALALASFASMPALAEGNGEAPTFESRDEAEQKRSQNSSSAAPDGSHAAPWEGAAIEVTARGTAADWPSMLATEVLDYDHAIAAPADFQDWITRVPGIGATGQNGIFETFSIRGSGGNGILILAAGVPVAAQRRAGVPVSFVEPSLLGDVSVTRGPAVVHFGPGALGGAISLEPRWFGAPFASAGYATAGDEWNVAAGTGSDGFSIGVARHRAGDTEAPDGTPLNTSYERDSATLQLRQRFDAFEFDALLMPSRTEDIGKSNSRFPNRQATTYPEDKHVIGRLRLRHDAGFEASAYAHDQELHTFKQTPGEADEFAFIGSTEGGATVQQTWSGDAFDTNLGIEYFGRRDVNGYDAVGNPAERTFSLVDASENSWSLFAITDWRVAPQFALELGARHSWVEQYQQSASSDDADSAFSAGAIWSPGDTSQWTLNVASGYRFASLEERFYTGVTGRGEIVGNPNLGSEQSLGVDLGHQWHSGDWSSEIHVWRTDVDDLIQKIEIEPDVEGYVNVGEAELRGAEVALGWTPTANLALRADAAVVRGEDKTANQPLYGIPPLRAALEATWDIGDFTVAGRYTHRWHKDRPGFEELERDAVDIVDAELRYRVNPDLGIQFYLRNAFDEQYYATADELSTFAPERSIGVNVTWAMH
jgi:iron complex outermembrane receptor protein